MQGRSTASITPSDSFYGYFGSHSRWGFFTIAGGIGLGVELNKSERCFGAGATSAGGEVSPAKTSGCDSQLLIGINRNLSSVADLNGPLHPIYLMGRLSLGIVID